MEELKQAVSGILDTLLGYERQPDGTYRYEIYADYRDEIRPALCAMIFGFQGLVRQMCAKAFLRSKLLRRKNYKNSGFPIENRCFSGCGGRI